MKKLVITLLLCTGIVTSTLAQTDSTQSASNHKIVMQATFNGVTQRFTLDYIGYNFYRIKADSATISQPTMAVSLGCKKMTPFLLKLATSDEAHPFTAKITVYNKEKTVRVFLLQKAMLTSIYEDIGIRKAPPFAVNMDIKALAATIDGVKIL